MNRPGRIILFWGALRLGLLAQSSVAHEGLVESREQLWSAWVFDPGIVLPILLFSVWYALGLHQLWTRAHVRRGISESQAFCFALGILVLIIALVSPLHPWGQVLFSAHMTQHELLMLVAAPLIVLGKPMLAFTCAIPRRHMRLIAGRAKASGAARVLHWITLPFAAWLIHAAALWGWHLPFLFDATLHHEWVHAIQHASFFLSALLFWWAILHGRARSMGYGCAVLYLFTTALHSGLLGALIALSTRLIYPSYRLTTSNWGMSALEDQQLGGLIMWIPAGIVYIVAGLVLFAHWLHWSGIRAEENDLLPEPCSPSAQPT